MNILREDGFYSDFRFGIRFSGAVKILILVNIAVFVIIHIFRNVSWLFLFGLVPEFVFSRLMVWQLVSYLFLHAGLWHLALNMLMLWMFGSVVEGAWGTKSFLRYYFFTGIGAGLCSVIFAFHASYPVVGASGAIFGLLVAYAVMFPEHIILLFFIFPMKMKYAVIVLAGINLLGALSNPGGGIAYIAHLGGGLFGYMYLKSERLKLIISGAGITHLKDSWQREKVRKGKEEQEDIDRQIDVILDKISAQGMGSLTREERRTLERKSKKS